MFDFAIFRDYISLQKASRSCCANAKSRTRKSPMLYLHKGQMVPAPESSQKKTEVRSSKESSRSYFGVMEAK